MSLKDNNNKYIKKKSMILYSPYIYIYTLEILKAFNTGHDATFKRMYVSIFHRTHTSVS